MTPREIIARVATARGTTVTKLLSARLNQAIAHPRMECYWLLRKTTKLPSTAIARELNRTDHTTAMSGIRKIQRLVDADPAYGAELLAIANPAGVDVAADARRELMRLRRLLDAHLARLERGAA